MAEKKNKQGLPIGKPLTQEEYFKAINEARNGLDSDDIEFNALIDKGWSKLNADEVKFMATHLNIEYKTKDETLEDIKDFLGQK